MGKANGNVTDIFGAKILNQSGLTKDSVFKAPGNLGRVNTQDAIGGGMAFIVGELEKVDPKINEPLQSVTWQRDIPVKTGGGWVEFVSAFFADYATSGTNDNAQSGGQTNNNATILADISKDLYKVSIFSQILSVPYVDQQKLVSIGRNLESILKEGIQKNYNKYIDQNVYYGFEDNGFLGLVNNTDVTAASVATGASGLLTWISKTPDEILYDVNKLINDVWAAAEYDLTGMPNHVLVPPAMYADINSRKVSSAGTKSILEYLYENNLAKRQGITDFEIVPCRQCIGAGTNATNRMVAYVNDESKINFNITVPLNRIMTTPDTKDGAYLSRYAAQLSQVIIKYLQTIRYADGI